MLSVFTGAELLKISLQMTASLPIVTNSGQKGQNWENKEYPRLTGRAGKKE